MHYLLQSVSEIEKLRSSGRQFVFTGGACNILHPQGNQRNPGRDELMGWLESQRVWFFDPQIHPSTHGRNYDYDIHGPGEKLAREKALVTVYELSPYSYGGVTIMEALTDGCKGKQVIIWYSGGPDSFDDKGRPLFTPLTTESPNGIAAANSMRKNLRDMLADYQNVHFCHPLKRVQATLVQIAPQLFN